MEERSESITAPVLDDSLASWIVNADASRVRAKTISLKVRSNRPVCILIENETSSALSVSLVWKVADTPLNGSIPIPAVSTKASLLILMNVLFTEFPNPSVSLMTLISVGSSRAVTTSDEESVVRTVPPTRVLEKTGRVESFCSVIPIKLIVAVTTGSSKVNTR